MYSFSYLEAVCWFMSSSVSSSPTCRFLKRQVRWSGIPICFRISHSLLWSTVKGFGIVNKAEIDVFLGNCLGFWWSSRCWQFGLWFSQSCRLNLCRIPTPIFKPAENEWKNIFPVWIPGSQDLWVWLFYATEFGDNLLCTLVRNNSMCVLGLLFPLF